MPSSIAVHRVDVGRPLDPPPSSPSPRPERPMASTTLPETMSSSRPTGSGAERRTFDPESVRRGEELAERGRSAPRGGTGDLRRRRSMRPKLDAAGLSGTLLASLQDATTRWMTRRRARPLPWSFRRAAATARAACPRDRDETAGTFARDRERGSSRAPSGRGGPPPRVRARDGPQAVGQDRVVDPTGHCRVVHPHHDPSRGGIERASSQPIASRAAARPGSARATVDIASTKISIASVAAIGSSRLAEFEERLGGVRDRRSDVRVDDVGADRVVQSLDEIEQARHPADRGRRSPPSAASGWNGPSSRRTARSVASRVALSASRRASSHHRPSTGIGITPEDHRLRGWSPGVESPPGPSRTASPRMSSPSRSPRRWVSGPATSPQSFDRARPVSRRGVRSPGARRCPASSSRRSGGPCPSSASTTATESDRAVARRRSAPRIHRAARRSRSPRRARPPRDRGSIAGTGGSTSQAAAVTVPSPSPRRSAGSTIAHLDLDAADATALTTLQPRREADDAEQHECRGADSGGSMPPGRVDGRCRHLLRRLETDRCQASVAASRSVSIARCRASSPPTDHHVRDLRPSTVGRGDRPIRLDDPAGEAAAFERSAAGGKQSRSPSRPRSRPAGRWRSRQPVLALAGRWSPEAKSRRRWEGVAVRADHAKAVRSRLFVEFEQEPPTGPSARQDDHGVAEIDFAEPVELVDRAAVARTGQRTAAPTAIAGEFPLPEAGRRRMAAVSDAIDRPEVVGLCPPGPWSQTPPPGA